MAAPVNIACRMKSHTAKTYQVGVWRPENTVLGCVPRTDGGEMVIAPTDLRTQPLPTGWQTMNKFSLEGGNTEYLPNLPPSLEAMWVSKNKLKELPQLPATLTILSADKNSLESLPALPPALEYLSVKNNKLTSLPAFPNTLDSLHITNNEIKEIPSLSRTVCQSLGAGNNKLSALPPLPSILRKLGCANNNIQEIKGLPYRLRVLSCSHNPLKTLDIENVKRIKTIIATHCGLKFLPLLPGVERDGEDLPTESFDQIEDKREYIFDNNELTPEFAAIYQRYKDAYVGMQVWQEEGYYSPRRPGSTRQFRQEILAEHRRILRERAKSVAALREVFKGSLRPGAPRSAAERALGANYGVGNIIAQFITGLPGTAEQQRLGVLAQREALRNVPAGTTVAAKRKIAKIAARPGVPIGPATESEAYLQKRAKLYLTDEDLKAAQKEFLDKLDELLGRMDLEERIRMGLRTKARLLNDLRVGALRLEIELLQFQTGLSAQRDEDVEEYFADVEEQFTDFADTFVSSDDDLSPEMVGQIRDTLEGRDPILVEAARLKMTYLLANRIAEYVEVVDETIRNIATGLARYPQFFTVDGALELYRTLEEVVRQAIEHLFGDGDIDYLNDIHLELRDQMRPTSARPVAEQARGEAEAVAAVQALVTDVNDNNNEGEALGIAMAALAAEEEAQGEDFLGNDNNNNNQEGGKRKHRVTPRNRKSKRLTRKQK